MHNMTLATNDTDQLLQPSQILLSEGRGVAPHADLQRINQAARVAVDGATLEAEQPMRSMDLKITRPLSCQLNTVRTGQLTCVFTLVRYRSWLPPLVVVGRAMVRCRRLTGK